jgi:hypothetical protein
MLSLRERFPLAALARAGSTALAGGAALAGCAAPATVAPAPDASDPVCAEVLLRSPHVLLGLERRPTTSQASRAWGDAPVVLRCGVEPPGPSPERCVRIEGVGGDVVDWLALEGEDSWVFVTYGRSPAVEVTVPFAVLPDGAQPTTPLVDLGPAIAVTQVERTCL